MASQAGGIMVVCEGLCGTVMERRVKVRTRIDTVGKRIFRRGSVKGESWSGGGGWCMKW